LSTYSNNEKEIFLKRITVGTIAASKQRAVELGDLITKTGLATIVVEVSDLTNASDRSMRQFVDADPEVILVDSPESTAALQIVHAIHAGLPDTRLLVISSITDPEIIIELMRAGVREVLPCPLTQAALIEAFNRHISQKARAISHTQTRAKKKGRIYCVTSAKQGSGATTIAINVAGIIAARSSQRTALIDLDRPLGDAAAYLNVKPDFTVSDALSAGQRLDSVLLESYMKLIHGFHMLAGFREHGADTSFSADKLSQLLDVTQKTFEHAIVDLPANLDEEQVKVIIRYSETIMVILTPDLPAVWRAERLLKYLTGLEGSDKIRIVVNRSTHSDEITDRDIVRLLEAQLYSKLPNEYSACIRAINSGSLLETAHSKHLSRAIAALATEIAGLAEIERRHRLFGLFLKPSVGGINA
jgi:pilus assembly protein CpaE